MPRGRPRKKVNQKETVTSKSAELVKMLEKNPELLDKMLNFASGGSNNVLEPSAVPKQEKGPIIGEVFEGITICALCGKEQKTWSTNPKGTVTQNVCTKCSLHISLLPPSERSAYLKTNLKSSHLEIARAKFKASQKIWGKEKQKQKEEKNTLNFNVTGDE